MTSRDPSRHGGNTDSIFGALGMTDSRVFGATSSSSSFADGTARAGPDSAFMARQAWRLVTRDDFSLHRIFMTYRAARPALGLALLAAQLVAVYLNVSSGWQVWLPVVLCALYATEALALWAMPNLLGAVRERVRRRYVVATIGVDVVVFSLLRWVDPGSNLNHAALLVLPVLMAGVLLKRLYALALAAAVSITLLAMTAFDLLHGRNSGDWGGALSQTGLAGIGLFVVALLAEQMAQRLVREERTARESFELARQQAQLNRLVIDEMTDGVIVVDQRNRVRIANPAARLLLAPDGDCPRVPFSLLSRPGWNRLAAAIEGAFETGFWPDTGLDLTLSDGPQRKRTVRTRARFTVGGRPLAGAQTTDDGEVLGVLFLEDYRLAQARSRQERLAAMGKMSAGVAHEFRNPLAAVTQANALLQEDALRPDQAKLVRIMTDNLARLKRIVDDVMEVAPGGAATSEEIDARAHVLAICGDWARTVGLNEDDGRLRRSVPLTAVPVLFDPEHLRRVLVNLLDNALRYASQAPGAITVTLETLDSPFARLAVASDGEAVAPEVESHLFEPFHSTRSRGTGLGLYICRELCARHGASIDYSRRDSGPHANVFQMVMRRPAMAGQSPVPTAPEAA